MSFQPLTKSELEQIDSHLTPSDSISITRHTNSELYNVIVDIKIKQNSDRRAEKLIRNHRFLIDNFEDGGDGLVHLYQHYR